MESTLASDLLEACKVLEVKDLTYEEIEKVLDYTRKKVTDPKGYMDDLQKLKLAELTRGLSTKIEDYRKEAATRGIKATDGTVAASRAEISIQGRTIVIEKIGASQKARITGIANQRYLNKYKENRAPFNFVEAVNHAEQDNLGQIADEIDVNLGLLGHQTTTANQVRNSVKGKIYMFVEQKVCSNCTAGFEAVHKTFGPLKQFSDEYPYIELTIQNAENNIILIVKAGQISIN
ncbi:MAG: hypothetical protein HC880_00580 [Bacteroidia bacterium]|nr:hypothetical protein [Bacteroidia bacterium]